MSAAYYYMNFTHCTFVNSFHEKKNWYLSKKIKILNKNGREVCQPHGFVSRKNLPEKTACCAKTKKPLVLVFFGKNTPFNLLWPKFFLSSAAKICSIYRRLSARMFKCNVLVYEFMNTVSSGLYGGLKVKIGNRTGTKFFLLVWTFSKMERSFVCPWGPTKKSASAFLSRSHVFGP